MSGEASMPRGRILVCGGRDFANPDAKLPAEVAEDIALMASVLYPIAQSEHGAEIILVHGFAKGADTLAAEMWEGWGCPTEGHRADWRQYGKAAGPIRNQEMLDTGIDEVIAFPGGKGTADMVRRAEKAGVPVRKIGWE
jgi:YspA, cpYpsA-related SLOG family